MLAFFGLLVPRLSGPEIVAIDLAVGEEHATVMQMVVGFAGELFHGEMPGDNHA
jgi:hypothetical protein